MYAHSELNIYTCNASLADAQKRQGVAAGRLVTGLVPAADMPLTISQLDVSQKHDLQLST
jgi:hypothetical protein